jgi:drug/metabolite transporter (DMT)-like permease
MLSSGNRRSQGWTLILGAILGAVAGLGAAYVFVRARRKAGKEGSSVTPSAAVRIGLLLLGLLRQVGEIAEGHK